MSMSRDVGAERWSLAHRVGFRFLFSYIIISQFPFPLSRMPGADALLDRYGDLWDAIVLWVGKHVLHMSRDIPLAETGSGDKTSDYIRLLCFLVLAAAATLVWSLVDARRPHYKKLRDGLRVFVRYALGAVLIEYGLFKLFKTQFSSPAPWRLVETYGQSSPMGLLWTFMGYSTPYNIFTGIAEAGGGLLLYFRRTTTAGALLGGAVMANVVMLNYCFDVPVKLTSTQLVLAAVYLLLPDLHRLANVLVWNRPTAAAAPRAPFDARWLERARPALKLLFLGWLLVNGARGELDSLKEMQDATSYPLYGYYEVEAFAKNGATPALWPAEATRWQNVLVPGEGFIKVKQMDNTDKGYRMEDDPANKTLKLTSFKEPKDEGGTLTYSQPDPDHLVLEGTWGSEPISVRLRKVDVSKMPLMSRGFHWISEVPYNR